MGEDRLLSRAFVLAFAANLMASITFFSLLHLPGYLKRLGADEFVIGFMMGIMSASAIAFRPAIGKMLDRHGRRLVAVLGCAINIAACALYLTVDSVGPWLVTVRLLHGLADAMLFSVFFTIAADVVPAGRRTQGIALFGISGMLPLALGGLAGDWILSWGDYRELFIFTTGAAVLSGAFALPIGDTRPDDGDEPARTFFRAVSEPRLLPVWLVTFAFAIGIASYLTFIRTFIDWRGFGSVGIFFSAYSISAIALRLLLGWLPDRLGPRAVLGPSLLCLAGGIGVLAIAPSTAFIIVAGVLCGVGHGYAFPIASAIVVNRARAAERGTGLAAFTAIFDVGLLIGGPTLGLIARGADYVTMFLTAAGVTVLGTLAAGAWDLIQDAGCRRDEYRDRRP